MAIDPSLVTEMGPDGLIRESPVIAHTERMIEEEQLQLRKYIDENYSKIRDVERELSNLTMEMKLTAGPKKAALEHMRKKIELSTERIRLAKIKEEEAKQAWEAASKGVKDEEAVKQKLCEDLNNLVQESSNSQFARLEELKRRLEALNPRRSSPFIAAAESPSGATANPDVSVPNTAQPQTQSASESSTKVSNEGGVESQKSTGPHADGTTKKKIAMQGRGRGVGAVPKSRGSSWTGAGFD